MTITLNGTTGITTPALDSQGVAVVNRQTTNGTIIDLRKDGTTVGSIGSHAGIYTYIGTGNAGLNFAGNISSVTPYNVTSNDYSDNAIDLGTSSIRFKDLYLSGGVYLGGTVAANHLDDYEEGTWSPVITDGTNNATMDGGQTGGTYIKIGNQVTVNGNLYLYGKGSISGGLFISGLPFTVTSSVNRRTGSAFAFANGLSVTQGYVPSFFTLQNSTRLQLFLYDTTGGSSALDASETTNALYLTFGFTYNLN